MTDKQNESVVKSLEGISISLGRMAFYLSLIIDNKKKTLRMVDVDRSKVYKTHLGGKLKK